MTRAIGLLVFLLFCVSLPKAFDCLQTVDLGGKWTLRDARGIKKRESMDAQVPGGIYSDLRRNGLIGDPFYGKNDTATRWVANLSWTYQRDFEVNTTLLNHSKINLVFEGLDTFATVFLNDKIVGHSENMFVRYVMDVKNFVKLGTNNLTVHFESPIATADAIFENQAKKYPVVPMCVPDNYNGECHVNHIRKMQASFSWDWGPALPSVGIWKPVYLEAYNSTVIRDVNVFTEQNDQNDSWDVTVKTYLGNNSLIQGSLLIKLFTDITVVEKIEKLNLTQQTQKGELLHQTNFSVPKTNVKLWWPNGYGDQNLYVLKVTFVNLDGTEQMIKRLKIGFRTIELVEDEINSCFSIKKTGDLFLTDVVISEQGRRFYFKVNDVPIFAKGTNMIPVNLLPEHDSNKVNVKFLMKSAKDVHMNMIRVWGGGLYESDYLYDLADEYGILIWQDFMFACSMYPTTDDFLRTVKDEVAHQVKRLQHHASIAVWAGNNENEAALRQDWYGTGHNFTLYKNDYIKLYVDTVRETYRQFDNKPFLTSSPTNGIESDNEDFVAENPQSNFYGDVHFYNYLADGWETDIYPVTRFASEYGYQGMANIDSWLNVVENVSLLHPQSDFMAHRQHHPLGNGALKLLIDYQMNLPDPKHPNYYRAFIFYSQIYQAMAVKIETEFYRRWRSELTEDGQGYTMGALYWQLNDVWVAPTWASIDYENRWKMLHYYAKKFFAPVLITSNLDVSRQLDIYMVSDLLEPIFNATVLINVYNWNSQTPVEKKVTLNTDILPNMSKNLMSIFVDEYLSGTTCGSLTTAKTNCFFYMKVLDAKSNSLGPDNFAFPTPLKSANIRKANVTISNVKQISTNQFNVEIKSDAIALFVWLDSHSAHGLFSENGFVMVDKTKTVQFESQKNISAPDLLKVMTVTHLLDSKYF